MVRVQVAEGGVELGEELKGKLPKGEGLSCQSSVVIVFDYLTWGFRRASARCSRRGRVRKRDNT